MAAVVHRSNNGSVGQETTLSQLNMIPVPLELRTFLYQAYGIEPHMLAYFNQYEPNRLLFIEILELSTILPIQKREVGLPGQNEAPKRSHKSLWQSLTDVEREKLQRERRKRKAYKTSLCKAFRENNKCEYGAECVFAHGEKELRLPPQVKETYYLCCYDEGKVAQVDLILLKLAHPKYKTQLCNKFSIWNYCPYGSRCQFIHQRSFASVGLASAIKPEDAENVKNDSSRLGNFNAAQTKSRCTDLLPIPEKHLLFPEQNSFYCSLPSTDLNRIRNAGHFAEVINNQHSVSGNLNLTGTSDAGYRDESLGGSIRSRMNSSVLNGLNSLADDDSVLGQLSEQLNNMFV
uniref:C3H1-type domain-containing protein n=1 Tax=Setaria digitata TaxID=48799 RepID=A0A915Q5G6_9BILA